MLVELHPRFAHGAAQHEVILRSRKHRKCSFVRLKLIFGSRGVSDANHHSAAFLDGASLRHNSNELVSCAFPLVVKIEFAVVRELDLFGLYLVDKELAEVEFACFLGGHFGLGQVGHDCVVDLVAFAFDI